MASTLLWLSVLLQMILIISSDMITIPSDQPSFDQNYAVTWGGNHVSFLNQRSEVQLSMDQSSGSGFSSKLGYGSGFFHMKIKIPNKDSAGVVTAFYMSSNTSNHDELDFEFLGNKEGKPITLQTNIFTNGHGNREQRIYLWFDPTADFHGYKILWNPYQVAFFVDETPIRVFKNLTSRGVEYPSQAMQIIASLWDGEDWATDGGQTKTNWSQAPFTAQFQGFAVDGCISPPGSSASSCSSPGLWWNSASFRELNSSQNTAYQNVRKKYMTYDYCSDKQRFPVLPPECAMQNAR